MSNKDERFLEAIADNIDCDCEEDCLLCKIHHIAASTLNSVAEEMDYAVKQIKEAISITTRLKKSRKWLVLIVLGFIGCSYIKCLFYIRDVLEEITV